MAVETLGEALAYGWRITARCAWGKQRGIAIKKRVLPALVAGIAAALPALRLAAGEADLFDADERERGARARAGGGEADDEEIGVEAIMIFATSTRSKA
jgi:hypothetical protein